MGDGGVLSLGLEMGGGRFWIRTKGRDPKWGGYVLAPFSWLKIFEKMG